MEVKENINFLFIDIPKTGSSSIGQALRQNFNLTKVEKRRHIPARVYKKSLHNYKDLFKFSFVRNPWDRLWSLYNFIKQKEVVIPEFNNWLIDWDDSKDRCTQTAPWDKLISTTRKPQLYWITDNNGNTIIDFIGMFERLDQDFNIILNKLTELNMLSLKNINLPHTNASLDLRSYREIYSEESKRHVSHHFVSDIETFNYKF